MFLAPAPLPEAGLLADAASMSPRATLQVVVHPWRSRDLWVGEPVRLDLTPAELDRLRRDPGAARRSAVGALLRRAWLRSLDGEPDDVDAIEAHLEVRPGLRPGDGGVLGHESSTPTWPTASWAGA